MDVDGGTDEMAIVELQVTIIIRNTHFRMKIRVLGECKNVSSGVGVGWCWLV